MRATLLMAIALIWLPADVWGQDLWPTHDHAPAGESMASPEVSAFLARARAAGERYEDRRNAILDGYRRLGPDFPAMGEHWIHPGRMIAGEVDPDRPQALAYAPIDGRPRLMGVIYAMPLRMDEAPPDFPSPGVWHDHSGTIDEESVLLLRHTLGGDSAAGGLRLAMMHVWLRPENPRGPFESENWTLPFHRLGIPPPDPLPVDAARTVSLASGGDAYYRLLLHTVGQPDEVDAEVAERLIHRSSQRVLGWLSGRANPDAALDDGEVRALEELWGRLWIDVTSHVSPAVAERLQPMVMP
jgi:hypothetical protein